MTNPIRDAAGNVLEVGDWVADSASGSMEREGDQMQVRGFVDGVCVTGDPLRNDVEDLYIFNPGQLRKLNADRTGWYEPPRERLQVLKHVGEDIVIPRLTRAQSEKLAALLGADGVEVV